MLPSHRSAVLRYLSALVGVSAAIALRAALSPALGGQIPFVTLFPAIVLIAWYGGLGPALLGLVLSILATSYLFLEPAGSFRISDPSSLFSLTAFVLFGFLTALLGDAQRRSRVRAEAEAAERRLIAEKERAQKERFEVTLASIGDAVIATDAEGRVQFMNAVAERLTGWNSSAACGTPAGRVFRIASERTGKELENPLRRVIEEGTVTGLANHTALIAAGGERIPISDSAAPIRAEDGRVIGAVLVFRDMRAEREAEELRLRAEEKCNAVMESIADAFYICDNEWRIGYANRRAEQVSGADREWLAGRRLWEALPAAPGTAEAELERAWREQRPAWIEVRSAGGTRLYEFLFSEAAGARAVFARDVTESRQAEEAQSHLAAIVESAEDAVISKDLHGTILTWNAGAERVYGYPASEIIGLAMALLVPAERQQEETEILERIRSGGAVRHFETVRLHKDGREVAISLTASPIRDRAGRITGVSHIARDITLRKQTEEQLQQTQRLESLGVLAGGIAHDFNNLLVGIIGNASLALDTMAPGNPVRAWIEGVATAGERAAQLTRQMLAYAGKGRFVVERVDPAAFIRDTAALIKAAIPRTVELRMELGDAVPAIEADVAQLQQVVMNLVINGAEAIPEGRPGTVTVRVDGITADEAYLERIGAAGEIGPGRYALLEVEDTGRGMDEATRARIYDPFFSTKFTGRGLGLAAASGIVRGHRGLIRVTSAPGQGSTFRVLLPAALQPAIEEPRRDGTLAAGVDGRPRGLVLVVDDEEIVRATAQQTLEQHGYSVLLAENGEIAVEQFARHKDEVAVVLLDMTMPVMSGEETLQRLKALRPDVRVVLSTGFSEDEAARRFEGQGLVGFVQKPYRATHLAEKLHAAVG